MSDAVRYSVERIRASKKLALIIKLTDLVTISDAK